MLLSVGGAYTAGISGVEDSSDSGDTSSETKPGILVVLILLTGHLRSIMYEFQ